MGVGDLKRPGFRPGRPSRRPESVALSRVLGEGEDLLTWSLPVFSSGALRVRVHFVFILAAVWEAVLSISRAHAGPVHVFTAVIVLALLVAVREVGRWCLSRRTGDAPDQIVLWPLGLLSATGSERPTPPSAGSAIGGLVINLLLTPVLAGSLWLAGQGWDSLVFNPLAPLAIVGRIGSLPVAALWWAYYLNVLLLGINLLVPMLPLDAGRVVEAFLARRVDGRRAAMAACRIGLLSALVLFVGAMTADQVRLVGLAVFGTAVCWIHLRRIEFLHETEIPRDFPGAADPLGPRPADPPDRATARADVPLMPPAPPVDDPAEVDRILAKISAAGLSGLSTEERRILAAATERARNTRAGNTKNR